MEPPPFDTLGLFTFTRTYARRHKSDDPKSSVESWEECIRRVVNACNTQLHVGFTDTEMGEVFSLLYNLKCSVAGRFMWQLGTSTVDRLGLMSLQNCAFRTINEPVKPFGWIFDALMLGCGVGFNIQKEYISQLPIVKHADITRNDSRDADFIVPDSREGWTKLINKVMKAHFYGYDGRGFSYSCILLRGKGAPIKSFGGIASGPETLCEGVAKINNILNTRAGQQARSIDLLDVVNIIGQIVISGNVRRCLPKGSHVFMKNGLTKIEDVIVGELVLTSDGYKKVTAKFDQGVQELVTINTANGKFWCTPNHRMAVYNKKTEKKEWIEARYLNYTHYLITTKYIEGTGDRKAYLANMQYPVITTDIYFAYDLQSLLFSCGVDNTITHSHNGYSVSIGESGEGLSKVNGLEYNYDYEHTYDIEVEDNHEFYCNGYLVHNSAQISLGDCDDEEFLKAKDWSSGSIPSWRCFSNNSVVCNDINKVINNEAFWKGYNGDGEPYGLVNLELAKKCGRIGDFRYTDPNIQGVNPCSEQSLESSETCCLAELYLPNIKTKEELYKCTTFMYRINKHSLALPCHHPETEKVVHKNMRMGIGVTGYLQASEEQKSWLPDCYEYLRAYDVAYSSSHNFPISIKLTTVKPSGTLSLLAGVTPGIHPAYSQYYIRRVRFSSDSSLIPIAEKNGYHVEYVQNFDGTLDHSTKIVEFPYKVADGTILAENCPAIEQLEWMRRIQRDWSDNAVSITVVYKKEELPGIKEWLVKNYNDSVKAVSFLLHYGHGFKQAPMEPISKERYEELSSKVTQISTLNTTLEMTDDDEYQNGECIGGMCPIK